MKINRNEQYQSGISSLTRLSAPIGQQIVPCHIVVDIKMQDFRQNAKLVTGLNIAKSLDSITYTSIVSRETDRISLMITTLNDVEVKLADILNAYVQAPVIDNVWTTLILEFGKDA